MKVEMREASNGALDKGEDPFGFHRGRVALRKAPEYMMAVAELL